MGFAGAGHRPSKFIANQYKKIRFQTYATWRMLKGTYKDIRTFLLFIGHPRSGHTLISALLDAHPEAILANELNVMQHVEFGARRASLYGRIIESAELFAREDAIWQGYSYSVPNQWQGRFTRLRVIGDKCAAKTISRLAAQPELLPRLQNIVGRDVEIKFVNVTRNPFDNLATIRRRRPFVPFEQQYEHFFARCEGIERLKQSIDSSRILDIRLEDFILDPKPGIARLCGHSNLDYTDQYLRDCASIVFEVPNKTRHGMQWTPDMIKNISAKIERYPFLIDYTFGS